MCEMLGGISKKAGYKLLHSGEVPSFRLGKEYKIPKMNIIAYLQRNIVLD
ncbi:helix-turn-helix domain-containing protein [Ruminococcaceae bacterium OttesenSCG-928-A16]|nr:helix-turn-helix domain-containing protein [Ruminococcaceae bacterium OttesenSCG-928-A16]